ncbi:MAG: hypothetical protein AB9846_09360 [Tenuifilaceae bacterium]
MRTKLLIISAIFFLSTEINNAQEKKDTIPAFFGISYIPKLNWAVQNITNDDGKFLKYNFNLNSFSSFEGNFGIRRIGVKVGLSANIENNLVGKAYRWGGYLGYKNYWLRLQRSKVSGEVEWSGPLPAGFLSSHKFSSNYFNVEILKTTKKKRYIDGKWVVMPIENQMGFYWGIGYTSLGLPIKFSTLTTPGGRENQKFGIPAYDTLFTAKFYTASFGFDLLRNLCLTAGKSGLAPGIPPKRFAVYASTADKVGFGTGKISDYGVKMAEALNDPSLTFVDSKSFSIMVHYQLSLGFRYLITARPVFIILAAGYDFEGAAIMPFGGAADTNKDLGYDALFYYMNHGVSFKIFISWMGNK